MPLVVSASRESYKCLLKHRVNRLRTSYCYYPRGNAEAASEPRCLHGNTHGSATKRTSSFSSKACEWISNIPWGQVTCNVQGWVPSRNPSSQNYYRRTSDFTGKPYREGWVLTGSHFLLLSKRSVSRFGSYHRLSTLMVISQLNITQTDCLLCPVVSCGPKKPTKYLSY